MKHVLVIDDSPLFREYLKSKLSEKGLEVSVAINSLDGMTKIRNLMPDLVILDYLLSRQNSINVLKEMGKNSHIAKIPVIITAQRLDQKHIFDLVRYNVKKVFTKPIKMDMLFSTLANILGVSITLDETPSIVEAHVNDEIIFIEISQGLNQEKLDLLYFKIVELIELYEIRIPKIIVMLSNMSLSFIDGPNIEKLMNTILKASRVKQRHIRILTKDDFTRKFILGRKEYKDIGVTANLQYAMEGLLSELDPSLEFGAKKAQIIGDRVLQAGKSVQGEMVDLKFQTEGRKNPLVMEDLRESIKNVKIAVVDDDFVIQELLKTTFEKVGAQVSSFPDGEDYLKQVGEKEFDLVFLDLMMPKIGGFTVLKELRERNIKQPVIVLSAVSQREAVVKAFKSGIKSYLVKPLTPADILKKALEILRPNF